MDGANAWKTFTRITLPLVKPALLVAVLFRILDTLRIFDLPFVLVGPHKYSVETLSMLAYDEAPIPDTGRRRRTRRCCSSTSPWSRIVFVKILGADVHRRGPGQKKPGGGTASGGQVDARPDTISASVGAVASGGGGF